MKTLSAPIPGQSLTTEPKGYPWERPPEIVDPEEAIQFHLLEMYKPKKLRAALDLMEIEGFDIQTLVNGRIRGAVADGMHTIDVGLIIAPVLHAFLKEAAKAAGIDAKDGFVNEAAEEKYKKGRVEGISRKELEKLTVQGPKRAVKEMEAQESKAEPEAATKEPRKGLMARGDM